MQSFAKMLVQKLPSWQVVLVDLRCHGESPAPGDSAHSVASSAADVIKLLRNLKIFPRLLIGHSYGGKVVMSMAGQFGNRVPKTVQIWVLDSLPGEVRAGGEPGAPPQDHPAELISMLQTLPQSALSDRRELQDLLTQRGFSIGVAQWVASSLKQSDPALRRLTWAFDLDGVSDMYASYEETDLWEVVRQLPEGIRLDFVRAERSSFRWAGQDEADIHAHGHGVHLLRDSGHWVHVDNPTELTDIIVDSVRHM